MNDTRNRQPKGLPVGGQFAADQRAESGVSLGESGGSAEPDYSTWTPVQVDTELARLYDEHGRAMNRFTAHYGYVSGGVARHLGRGWRGKAKRDEIIERVEELQAQRDAGQPVFGNDSTLLSEWDNAQQSLDKAHALAQEMEPLDEEYEVRGGWPRAFLVANANGHVHKSMHCSSCFRPGYDGQGNYREGTRYHWVTELSDATEDEIVDAAGERACTICFPTAPVETLSKPTRLFTPDEVEKAKAREERAAAKAERERKRIEKALTPDGSDLTVSLGMGPGHVRQPDGSTIWKPDAREQTETFKTLTAARSWLTDAKMWGEGHPSFPDTAVQQVAEAVAAKEGKDVETVLAEAEKRAAKRR